MRTMFPSLRLWSAVALLGLLVATAPLGCQAQESSAAADCALVLQQGVYNTITSTSTSAAYSNVMSALCQNYSSYSFNTYASDRAALDSYITQHAGGDSSYFRNADMKNLASSYCDSKAHSFDVAAKVSAGKFKASGSASQSDASSNCGALTSASSTAANGGDDSYFTGYHAKVAQSAYTSTATAITKTQSTMCASSSAINSGSAEVTYLSQVIDTNVHTAYKDCLANFAAGIRYKPMTGTGSRSFSLDISYTPSAQGGLASLLGVTIDPVGTAACVLLGCNRTVPECAVDGVMAIPLEEHKVYTVKCHVVNPPTSVAGNFTTVWISTNPGGSYRGFLSRLAPPTQVVPMYQRAAVDELRRVSDIITLKNTVAGLSKQVADLNKRLTDVVTPTVNNQTALVDAAEQALTSRMQQFNDAARRGTMQITSLQNQNARQASTIAFISRYRSVPMGALLQWGGSYPPPGYLLADGSAVSRSTYGGLYFMFGTTYGVGDGSTTFNLPDLRGRVPVGTGGGPETHDRDVGVRMGEEAHTLTAFELPFHSHYGSTDGGMATLSGQRSYQACVGTSAFGVKYGLRDSNTVGSSCNATGTTNCWNHVHNFRTDESAWPPAAPHNNIQPSLVVNYIIKYVVG
ncbi:hypothetical protein HYH03_013532 [Edaphochlamys debaryana]|uniref:Phage tail collar domain-containing protein n=1 Tax=Edaphochlamys debaryana TaxID=47281 RepID=A0A835XPQ2_9CHLO|nr:hypothetical protein HYH03_013532 [Edaphochlamys debaryana]|eukprot:KAG2487953.1 hypothetical protein HYH03_013532 [Edaphochlamys debaryana]